MALGVTSYVDPGVYIRERIQPSSITVTSDRVLGIVGLAPRTVRTTDEAVVRGKILDETLSLAASTPYVGYLTSTCDRDRNNAICYNNDQAMALGAWSFTAASLVGGEWAGTSLNLTSNYFLSLSIDGKDPVTIDFRDGLTTVLGAGFYITSIAAVDADELVRWINYELSNASGTHYSEYGTDYASFATQANTPTRPLVTLTSPSTDSSSDIKIFLSEATDASDLISTAATGWANAIGTLKPTALLGVQAPTQVQIADASYSSTSTYTIEYVAVDSQTDSLLNADSDTPLDDLISVGSFPGGLNYVEDTDFAETGNTVDWDVGTNAQAVISTAYASDTLTTADNTLILSINGLAAVTIAFIPGVVSAATAAAAINAALVADAAYGPEYAHVATVALTFLVITAPLQFDNFPKDSLGGTYKGASSSITLVSGTTCWSSIFGLAASAQIPKTYNGVGSRPSYGSVFYTTYDSDRASTDYDSATRVYSPSELYEYTSPLTMSNYASNSLAVAGEIAFENGASSMYLVQIDDTVSEGFPTQNEIDAALVVAGQSSVITDVVVVDAVSGSELSTDVSLMNHVSSMSSLTEKKYRRGWFGMPRGTAVGDPDTEDTFVYRSVRTLQPGNTSPGRGRLILCAPSECSRTLTTETGSEVTVELDGKYLAVANAAVFCSLPSPSDAMLGKFLVGFLTDSTFETYLQGERHTLAGNGINVATLDAGNIKLLDPLTTEDGGGKVIQFAEPSSSAQKDAVNRAIEAVLDANVKGIVPDDLADFIIDIKAWIGLTIKSQINAGVIGPYKNEDGTTRELSFMSDIQAFQDSTDQRTFTFKYYFNLKYVAKRFFGEYSVDNPFFTA